MKKQFIKIGITLAFGAFLVGSLFSYKGFTQAENRDKDTRNVSQIQNKPELLNSITGMGKNKLIEPLNVVVSSSEDIFVADKGSGQIKVYNAKAKLIRVIGEKGKKRGQFVYPYGLVITSQGNLWVGDPEKNTVEQFDIQGNFTKEIIGQKDNIKPGLMARDQNRIYISDLQGKKIYIYNELGEKKGEYLGNFSSPQGLAISKNKRLWVGDAGVISTIKVLSDEGLVEKQIQSDAKNKSYFTTVRGLALDSSDRLFAVDSMAHKIKVFNQKGELMFQFGGSGVGNHQFNFPNGIFVDATDRIYIADRFNKRIQIWGY